MSHQPETYRLTTRYPDLQARPACAAYLAAVAGRFELCLRCKDILSAHRHAHRQATYAQPCNRSARHYEALSHKSSRGAALAPTPELESTSRRSIASR